MIKKSLLLILLALSLPACNTMSRGAMSTPILLGNSSSSDLIKSSNQAADELAKLPADLAQLEKPTVIMTTFVDSNNFLESSTLGRTSSEIIAGKLAQNGFPIKEIRLRSDILVKGNKGEMLLSREFKEVAKQHSADAVVVGTYAEAAHQVYVSTKLIRLDDERVLSAHNFSLEKTADIATLLHGVRTKDRYPVVEGDEDTSSDSTNNASGSEDNLMDTLRAYDKKINDKRMNRKL